MPEHVVLLPSDELEQMLEGKGTSIDEVLEQNGFSTAPGTNPAARGGPSSKREAVSIILATAGLVMAATPSISKSVHALLRRSLVVDEMVLAPVEDSAGNVVKDSRTGEPITHWVSRKRLLDAGPSALKTTINLEGPVGLKLSLQEDGA